MALELVTLAFFASVRLTADTSENFLITLDEIAALIGAIIAVFTTPIAKFFEITRCVGWVINDFTVPVPNCWLTILIPVLVIGAFAPGPPIKPAVTPLTTPETIAFVAICHLEIFPPFELSILSLATEAAAAVTPLITPTATAPRLLPNVAPVIAPSTKLTAVLRY